MATSLTPMAIAISVVLHKAKHMETAYINGVMEKYMMENGKMGSRMEMGCGKGSMEIAILANGKTLEQMDMAFMSGVMVIDTKASGKADSNMATALTSLQTAMSMSAIT